MALRKFFISYRRHDSQWPAHMLYNELRSHFSREQIFFDVDTIEPGRDFQEVIEKEIDRCDVMLAVIGDRWQQAINLSVKGVALDFVRIEIATALRHPIPVIPVMVDDAILPKHEELPEDMRGMLRRQAIVLRHGHFREDAQEVVKTLKKMLRDAQENEEKAWATALAKNEVHYFEEYLRLYPSGEYAEEARQVLQEKNQSEPERSLDEEWKEVAMKMTREMRNPLTPMKLSMQYLEKAMKSDQPNIKQLAASVTETMIEQIDHLAKIIKGLTTYLSVEIDPQEMVDLHQVLDEVRFLNREKNNPAFLWKPVDQTVWIKANKQQLHDLFLHLQKNAQEACEKDCEIVVEEELTREGIKISICDNGTGIPEELRPMIFHLNVSTKTDGSGFGLLLCKKIVQQAGGKIWMETGLDGSTFHVVLPVKTQMAEQEKYK
jgi:signal transduction histidine kinase